MFRQICYDLLITSSDTENIIMKEKNNCFSAQERLIKLIKGDAFSYDNDHETNLDERITVSQVRSWLALLKANKRYRPKSIMNP